MKRLLFVLTALFVCQALFALDAEVVELTGKAQVSSNGTTWSPLAVGSVVSQGATIQTGFNSQLKLKVKGSTITLDPMTRIKVEQLSDKGNIDNTVVSMKIGGLTSNVKKVEDRRAGFTVKGPAATASVRGTILSEECGYNSDVVTSVENTTMVWPSSANDESTGDAESGSSQGKGARAINPGQVASVNSSGSQKAPSSHASEAAFGLGGAVASAAAQEGVATASSSPSDSMANNSGSSGAFEEIAPATGKIAVKVTFVE